jgi:hypothetical protein
MRRNHEQVILSTVTGGAGSRGKTRRPGAINARQELETARDAGPGRGDRRSALNARGHDVPGPRNGPGVGPDRQDPPSLRSAGPDRRRRSRAGLAPRRTRSPGHPHRDDDPRGRPPSAATRQPSGHAAAHPPDHPRDDQLPDLDHLAPPPRQPAQERGPFGLAHVPRPLRPPPPPRHRTGPDRTAGLGSFGAPAWRRSRGRSTRNGLVSPEVPEDPFGAPCWVRFAVIRRIFSICNALCKEVF